MIRARISVWHVNKRNGIGQVATYAREVIAVTLDSKFGHMVTHDNDVGWGVADPGTWLIEG